MKASPHCPSCSTLRHLLLSWDGQWFLKIAQRFGIDVAVELNAQVRRSFARIELREWLRQAGSEDRMETLSQAFDYLADYLAIGEIGGMRAQLKAEGSKGQITVHYCPAYAGVRTAGHARQDAACVACPGTWQGWLGQLLGAVDESIEVGITAMLSSGASACSIGISIEDKEVPEAGGDNSRTLGQ
jgi:hypothetical protein